MTLPFSTKINGEPTYFPEKILSGLYDNKIITAEEVQDRFELSILVRKGEFTKSVLIKLNCINQNSTPSAKIKMTDGNQE